MTVLHALLNLAVIGWFLYNAWRHRHETTWQIMALAFLIGLYALYIPDRVRTFSVVN